MDLNSLAKSQKRNVDELYRPPPPQDYSQNYCRLILVISIAVVFIALEIIGGTISGSIAIISDAIHLVSDLLGFISSFLFLYWSKKEMNKKISFGYHRMELIGALSNIFIVWIMVLFIIYQATMRIVHKEFVRQPVIMLITAGVGLLINIILFNILHGGAEHELLEGYDEEQQAESEQQKTGVQSIGMKSAIIHALSDLVQSVGVLISALVIYFYGSNHGQEVTEWNSYHLFDPIATYVFSILSLLATLPVIKSCYYLIMESSPPNIDLDELKKECQNVEGVIEVHDIHAWDLKPGKSVVIGHVIAKPGAERIALMGLTDLCRRKKLYHSTFQVQEHFQNRKEYILCHNDIH